MKIAAEMEQWEVGESSLNETPLHLIAFRVGEPTPRPVSSHGKRVLITPEEAQRLVPLFHGKPIFATPNLNGDHQDSQKVPIGVVTSAHIDQDGNFVLVGWGWEESFPQLFQFIRANKGSLGTSYELKATEVQEQDGILVPRGLVPLGILIGERNRMANGNLSAVLYAEEGEHQTRDGLPFPADAFLYVPDPEKPSTWKLPFKEYVGGELQVTRRSLARAALALAHPSGFRGQKVDLEPEERLKAMRKLVALYKEHFGGVPDSIASFLIPALNRLRGRMEAETSPKEGHMGVLASLKRIFSSMLPEHPEVVFDVLEASEELQQLEQAYEALQAKYAQLEAAHEALKADYAQLEAAHRELQAQHERELAELTAALKAAENSKQEEEVQRQALTARLRQLRDFPWERLLSFQATEEDLKALGLLLASRDVRLEAGQEKPKNPFEEVLERAKQAKSIEEFEGLLFQGLQAIQV